MPCLTCRQERASCASLSRVLPHACAGSTAGQEGGSPRLAGGPGAGWWWTALAAPAAIWVTSDHTHTCGPCAQLSPCPHLPCLCRVVWFLDMPPTMCCTRLAALVLLAAVLAAAGGAAAVARPPLPNQDLFVSRQLDSENSGGKIVQANMCEEGHTVTGIIFG